MDDKVLHQLSEAQKFESVWQRPSQLATLIDDLDFVDSKIINNFEEDFFWHDYGRVVSVIDGIATVYGLKRIKSGHTVTFFNNELTQVEDSVKSFNSQTSTYDEAYDNAGDDEDEEEGPEGDEDESFEQELKKKLMKIMYLVTVSH